MQDDFGIYAIDTETTGLTPKDQVIELAWLKLPNELSYYQKDNLYNLIVDGIDLENHSYVERFMPSVPINPHAQKIHGISKLKLLGCRPSYQAVLPANTALVIGHNTAFDKRMLGRSIKHICVWRMAQKIEKINKRKFGFENYKLITMFEFYYPELAHMFKTEHHSALGDTRMTVLVLIKLLATFPFLETMYAVEDYFFGDNNA